MSQLGKIARDALTLPWLNTHERKVLQSMADCQTARLGANACFCECGNFEVHYNSCRDRHCPLCQGSLRAKWVKDRLTELLPCPYFHVVFTVPHELDFVAMGNRRVFYGMLFRCVHKTLLSVASREENLGARIGGLSVLHTWNQKLAFHPHLHCIVPGGGISSEGTWVKGRTNYLLSVRRLSAVFRGKLLGALESACEKGDLFGDRQRILEALKKASQKNFVVYAKPPFGGPEQVLKYLGRYTHRVGISEKRIIRYDNKTVTFSWIDRAENHVSRLMSLPLSDFVKKFMLHLIPKGMRKIRYFGYMANRNRGKSIQTVRQLIVEAGVSPAKEASWETAKQGEETPFIQKERLCSKCGQKWGPLKAMTCLGDLVLLEDLGPDPNYAVS